jgi:N-acetylneuraminic acid mutarotase
LVAGGAVLVGCSGQSSPQAGSSPSGRSSTSTTPSQPSSPQQPPATLHARVAPWELPAARSREVALPTAGGLAVAGGLSSAHVSTSTVWILSPTSGRVEHRGSLAVAVHDATGLIVNRVPYVIAGGNTTTVGDVQAIPYGGPAHVVSHLPQPRSDLSADVVEGSGYVLGGFDGATSLSAVLRTDDGRHFTTVARLRITVRYAAVASVVSPAGDQLLVFGGEHNGVPIDDVQDIDLTTGRTRVVGHLPEPLAHEAAFSLRDRIWLAGGRSHDQLQSRIWRWDPTRHQASPAGRLPYAVADAGVASGPSTAYIVGGETPEPTARVILLSTE